MLLPCSLTAEVGPGNSVQLSLSLAVGETEASVSIDLCLTCLPGPGSSQASFKQTTVSRVLCFPACPPLLFSGTGSQPAPVSVVWWHTAPGSFLISAGFRTLLPLSASQAAHITALSDLEGEVSVPCMGASTVLASAHGHMLKCIWAVYLPGDLLP